MEKEKSDMFDENDPLSLKEIEENPVKLDFSGCKYIGEIHQVLKKGLGFPDYYGENLDALYDLLWDFRSYPIVIEIRGFDKLPLEFAPYVQEIKDVFNRVHSECPQIEFRIIS